MTQYTLRNIPPIVDRALRRRARLEHKSLNQVAIDSLNKQAQKFFGQWEKELAEYSSDSMREKSSARLDAAKQKFKTLGETLGEARKAFEPLVQSLNDQILYLGRDLSPEAVADLEDEAAELNKQAEDVMAKINDLLAKADKADADLESSTSE